MPEHLRVEWASLHEREYRLTSAGSFFFVLRKGKLREIWDCRRGGHRVAEGK
jgi:hypothetical protein